MEDKKDKKTSKIWWAGTSHHFTVLTHTHYEKSLKSKCVLSAWIHKVNNSS